MPEIVETWPGGTVTEDNPFGYEWDAWSDGQIRRFVKDRDFVVSAKAFTMAGRQWARRNGCEWKSRICAGTVWVQITKPEPDPLRAEAEAQEAAYRASEDAPPWL